MAYHSAADSNMINLFMSKVGSLGIKRARPQTIKRATFLAHTITSQFKPPRALLFSLPILIIVIDYATGWLAIVQRLLLELDKPAR